MRLAWHIARKDFRRLRVPVALWVVLIAAKFGVGAMLIFGIKIEFDSLRFASYWLAGLEMFGGYFLVAALVHGDVLVGTTSFWMTRPVSSARLFQGKLAGIVLLFGAIPLALTLPWWLTCGYGVNEMLLASAETLLLQGIVVFAALPLATMTDGLSRYLFWALISVTAVIFTGVMLSFVPGEGVVLGLLVFVVTGIVAAVRHVAKRRFWIGGTLFGGSIATAALIKGVFLIPNPVPRFMPPANSPSSHAAGFNLSYLGAVSGGNVRSERETNVSAILQAEGVPPELILQGSAVHRWTWSDGLKLERRGLLSAVAAENATWLALGLTSPSEDSQTVGRGINSFLRVQGVRAAQGDRPNVIGSEVLVPTAFSGRVLRDPPSYLLRADVRLMRPVIIGERPAKMGEKITSGSETSRVIDYRYNSRSRSWRNPRTGEVENDRWESLDVRVAEYMPTVFDVIEGRLGIGPFVLSLWPQRAYFVINRARGNAAGRSDGVYDARRSRIIRIGTVGITWRTLICNPPNENSVEGKQVPQLNWFENLSIAKVELREEERFTNDLRVDRFEFRRQRPAGGAP
jgi:hypothetical protein